ncbi:GMC family oxidoreductase [Neorhodopirellula pilleata]|uniref:Alcohol dehydrogenase [acceptor] n=1 Tax=Neorhodopirellula pilleata TaxID=2714738 RepID=A0A5C6AWL7_9BACT|nr:GMC family oxidoreductase [Neorhodopirellula pilleata]TWU03861.1 Alcohol dehydrogenase [acceptor] [Neorhodopirellula pilleata]
MRDCFDGFVIIGGGVCGCLLAHELITRTDANVWLIEAGGEQAENATDRQRPGRWLHLLGSSDDDSHPTEPSRSLAGRKMDWPRGRGLGGSGRINAMIWVPPHRHDWRMLSEAGLEPSQLERSFEVAMNRMATESPSYLSEPSRLFLAAMAMRSDFGTFAAYRRINRNSRRWTTEQLLDDVRHNNPAAAARLRIIRGSVSTLHVSNGRIESVVWSDSNSTNRTNLSSQTKIISCAGSLGTPRLLMQSGIGNADELSQLGLKTSVHLPAVGRSLHDHLIMPVVHSHDGQAFPGTPPNMSDLTRWQHGRTGPLASNIAECGGFDREHEFQWHVTPTDYLRYPNAKAEAAITLGVSLTRPRSRGQLRLFRDLASSSGFRLVIEAGYLDDLNDIERMIEGVRVTRNMAVHLSESGMRLFETVPGRRRESDEQLVAAIARYAQTLYHPGGTCAIGPVVDDRFNVHGLTNLSIVDASVLPHPTIANPTAVLATLGCLAASQLAI